MNKARVLFIVAYEGYQPIEYGEPKKLLEKAGFSVITASTRHGSALAKDGSTTPVDVILEKVNVDDYAGIFFIGGPGAMDHLDNATSYHIIQKAAQKKIPLGAICVSPRILAKAGVLQGKKATGWNADNALPEIYKEYGVLYSPEDVVVDGTIITATGPATAKKFGERIITLLKKK
jgi:protease I